MWYGSQGTDEMVRIPGYGVSRDSGADTGVRMWCRGTDEKVRTTWCGWGMDAGVRTRWCGDMGTDAGVRTRWCGDRGTDAGVRMKSMNDVVRMGYGCRGMDAGVRV